jgi:hypothetical protein
MDSGELLYVTSRLVFGGIAAILAIVLWSRTRDGAWMFVVFAVISTYIEIVYSILELLGVTQGLFITIGTTNVLKIIFSSLPPVFFICAFAMMLAKKIRRRSQRPL